MAVEVTIGGRRSLSPQTALIAAQMRETAKAQRIEAARLDEAADTLEGGPARPASRRPRRRRRPRFDTERIIAAAREMNAESSTEGPAGLAARSGYQFEMLFKRRVTNLAKTEPAVAAVVERYASVPS